MKPKVVAQASYAIEHFFKKKSLKCTDDIAG